MLGAAKDNERNQATSSFIHQHIDSHFEDKIIHQVRGMQIDEDETFNHVPFSQHLDDQILTCPKDDEFLNRVVRD